MQEKQSLITALNSLPRARFPSLYWKPVQDCYNYKVYAYKAVGLSLLIKNNVLLHTIFQASRNSLLVSQSTCVHTELPTILSKLGVPEATV